MKFPRALSTGSTRGSSAELHAPRAMSIVVAGSQRVPGKNVRLLAGHALLAYSISSALDSGVFDSVIVVTDRRVLDKQIRDTI